MARMINNKFGCVSTVESRCLGELERDLKVNKRWQNKIVRRDNKAKKGNKKTAKCAVK